MAWDTQGFWSTFEFVDRRGKVSRVRVQMRDAAYADAVSAMATVRGYLEAAIEATCTSCFLTERFENDAWEYPTIDCSVAERAILTMRVADKPGKKATFAIPAPASGIFEGTEGESANIVDGEDAAVQALVGMFAETDGECYISDGEMIADDDGFVRGRRSNRKYSQTTIE